MAAYRWAYGSCCPRIVALKALVVSNSAPIVRLGTWDVVASSLKGLRVRVAVVSSTPTQTGFRIVKLVAIRR
jgi:hypothetical protein